MQTLNAAEKPASDPRWKKVEDRFLAAIDPAQRPMVQVLLNNPRNGGRGLRLWLRKLGNLDQALPQAIPAELIEVYLSDHEALPLFDCHDCGLAVPVRFNSLDGYSDVPERVYFPCCPQCGGKTGMYAYWCNTVPQQEALHT